MKRVKFAIIPDLHGDYYRLKSTLSGLGFNTSLTRGGEMTWSHPDNVMAVFLGDYIDGGIENAAVIDTVQSMVLHGHALAIMGNHEFNALMFNIPDETGQNWVRPRSEANRRQHQSFIDEFGCLDEINHDSKEEKRLKNVLRWFRTLPAFIDLGSFRVVHAQWDESQINMLKIWGGSWKHGDLLSGVTIADCDPFTIANPATSPGYAVEVTLKGMEIGLPEGKDFLDFHGKLRSEMRLRWWASGEPTYQNLALSVPDPAVLPNEVIQGEMPFTRYPISDPPVFVGHYKMKGNPVVEPAEAAVSLDYPAPPCAYLWEPEDRKLREDRLLVF